MNFFDILFAEKHGEALSISHFDALFAKYIAPAAEIWGEYDGTLPAQYSANGDYLADYRIYGAVGGVGDDSGTAYGYVVPMSVSDGTTSTTTPIYIGSDPLGEDEYISYNEQKVYRRTENLYNSAKDTKNRLIYSNNGYSQYTTDYDSSNYIPISEGTYTISLYNDNPYGIFFRVNFYQSPSELGFQNNLIDTKIFNSYAEHQISIAQSGYIRIAFSHYTHERMLNIGESIAYQPYLQPTDPPMPLPALPTVDGMTITDYAGQSATASNNVLPSSTAQTQTSGNLSVTCDGEGRYHIDKTGSGDLYVYFDIPEFTIPISKQGGGNGTVSFFNTMDTSAMVFFMNGSTSVDSWQMNSKNRQTDGYGTMAGKTINRIGFNCWGGSWTGDINIMITDNGVLPSAFEPPSHALPKPSRFYAKYPKRNA